MVGPDQLVGNSLMIEERYRPNPLHYFQVTGVEIGNQVRSTST